MHHIKKITLFDKTFVVCQTSKSNNVEMLAFLSFRAMNVLGTWKRRLMEMAH